MAEIADVVERRRPASDARPEAPPGPEIPEGAGVAAWPGGKVVVVSVVGLFLLAVFYTLYFAKSVFIPIVLALLLSLVLAPLVRRLARIGIPNGLGAALVVVCLIGTAIVGVLQLSAPATEWLGRAPYSFARIEHRLQELRKPVEDVQEATKRVEELTSGNDGEQPAVVVEGPGLAQTLAVGTFSFVAGAAITIVLLFFILASGDLFLRKLVQVLPTLHDKKRAVEIARQTERDISRYLLTITCVNVCLGIATGVAMYFLGMPNPVLWGVVAGMLNFIPYIGPVITIAILSLVSLLSFYQWEQIVLPPLVFLALTSLEGQFITPMVVGRRLMLNPVVILLALLAWGWLWGVPGLLMAIPWLAAVKILCDHVEPLAPVGTFLGRRED